MKQNNPSPAAHSPELRTSAPVFNTPSPAAHSPEERTSTNPQSGRSAAHSGAPVEFSSKTLTSPELRTSETKLNASSPAAHSGWCEIFKTGTHTDAKGNTRNWTVEDLKTIKANFEQKNPDVPICCGHVKTNSPAYGWVHQMRIVPQFGQCDRALPNEVHISGDVGAQAKPSTTGAHNNPVYKLYCSFKDVANEFKEAVKKGLFKTRSISLNPDLTLRHIAFLGAMPPAIKGMEQFCFQSAAGGGVLNTGTEVRISDQSAADEISIEFNNENAAAGSDELSARYIFNNENAAAGSDELSARYICNNESIESDIYNAIPSGVNSPDTLKKEGVQMEENKMRPSSPCSTQADCGALNKKELEAAQNELKEQKEKALQLEEENASLKAQIEASKKEAQQKDFEEFCENAIKEGHILPANKVAAMNVLSALSECTFEFSEGRENPVEGFKKFVSSLKQMDFSQIATQDNVSEDKEINFGDKDEILSAIQKTQQDYLEKGVELNSAQALDIIKRSK